MAQQLRTVIYLRISKDRDGLATGVTDQERDCRDLVHRIAGPDTPITVLTDNDISASRYARRSRIAYAQLLDMIRADTVDMVVAHHIDRLYRQPVDLEELVRLIEQHSVRIETCLAGPVDLSTASGRLNARSLAGFAAYESEIKSERHRDRARHAALQGRPHGPQGYGWRRAYDDNGRAIDVIDPDEAAVIRRIADHIVAGGSLYALASQFIADGTPTARGGTWTPTAIRSIIRRPRNVALRSHRGTLSPATWEPILDRATWERCLAILDDPTRRTSPGPKPRHLLGGIAICDTCDSRMISGTNGLTRSYRCPRLCTSRQRAKVDAYVEEHLFALLTDPAARAALRPRPRTESVAALEADEQEAQTLRARLDIAAARWADGDLEDDQLAVINARLRPRLEQLRGRIAAHAAATAGPPLLDGLIDPDIDEVRRRWAAVPIERRRAIISAALTVRIRKVGKPVGRAPFDYSAVVVTRRRGGDGGV